jgi:DNA primase
MIDQATIERVLAAADIVEVISDFVTLKKAGANYRGLSPFKTEKTPSFFVSPQKGIFKCFSTNIGGNVTKFLMEHEKMTFPEAVHYLAKKYNIEIEEKELTEEQKQQQTNRSSMLEVVKFARNYFVDILKKHEEGKAIGLSYFKERGFREHIIEKFQLGYSLDEWTAFTDAATKAGYKMDFLVKTGLSIKKEETGKVFDRFKARVMFPIHGLSGQVEGFGGRALKKEEKAKYVNSPASEIYDKSLVLYGLFFSKNAIAKQEKCYLVEGYTDVISFHQSGIENVVASSGTALTKGQIKLIRRFTNNITIIYDGDEAGVNASIRGIDLILEEGMNVKILLLPDGEDPDSFAQKMSASELLEYISKNEKDFISFKTKLLLKDSQDDPVKKATTIQQIVSSISVIPDQILRSEYIKRCALMLDVKEELLYTEVSKRWIKKLEQDARRAKQEIKPETPKSTPIPSFISEVFIEPIENKLIRYLLLYPNFQLFQHDGAYFTVSEYIINEIINDDYKFSNLVNEKIFKEYQQKLIDGKVPDFNYFVHHPDEQINNIASRLVSETYELSKIHEKKGMHIETEDMILHELVPKDMENYKRKVLEFSRKEYLDKIKKAQDENDEEGMLEYQQHYYQIIKALKDLSDNNGWVTL